jgi:hypothetical protein
LALFSATEEGLIMAMTEREKLIETARARCRDLRALANRIEGAITELHSLGTDREESELRDLTEAPAAAIDIDASPNA